MAAPRESTTHADAGLEVGNGTSSMVATRARRVVRRRARRSARRFGASLAFAALFFAGAALSALAGAGVGSITGDPEIPPPGCVAPSGDEAVVPAEGEGCVEVGTTTTPETPAAPEESPAETADPGGETVPLAPEGGDDEAPAPAAEAAPASAPEPARGGSAGPQELGSSGSDEPAPGEGTTGSGARPAKTRPPAPPLVDEERPPGIDTSLDPEAETFANATVWLHRWLPDPTPRAKRLAPDFARRLVRTASRHGVSWALVLGVLRAEGHTGRVPAAAGTLDRVAARLSRARHDRRTRRPWLVALAYSGRTSFADRAVALARYNRAVGLRALVVGLKRAKPSLIERVLRDDAIRIYGGGRADVVRGRVDVRVLVLLRYLRLGHGSVTVSSLVAGHRVFSRPGVVSAHVYGLAVDISALGDEAITGSQGPGGLTERAVRSILLLPEELVPQQVISLLGLGGPSFPLADHHDHIHVGY